MPRMHKKMVLSRYFRTLSNDTGSTMLFVIVIGFISTILIASFLLTSNQTTKLSGGRRNNVDVLNIAEAGKETTLALLRNRTFIPRDGQDTIIFNNEAFSAGTFTVRCSTNLNIDSIYITSTGSLNSASITIKIIAKIDPDPWMRWVEGAITARIDVKLLGNIVADGRDYDTTGGLLGMLLTPWRGTFGVSSCGIVNADAASLVGGNTTAPTSPKLPNITVNENMSTTGYPTTPEEVLGLPAGSLDKYKTTTCPASDYYGIVYTEESCNFAGGIYICHNSTGTASLNNYNGNFKGLIIADEDKHINGGASVLGAVVFLGKNAGGNCIGNGGADIHYSSRMLNKVAKDLLPPPGRRTVTVVSWHEIK